MGEKLDDLQGQIKVTEADLAITPELVVSSEELAAASSTLAAASSTLAAASSTLAAWNALSEEERVNFTHNRVFHGLAHNTTKCEKDHVRNFGPGMTGDIGGQVPVEGEGLLDGRPWYFRARYNTWSFDWADTVEAEPVYVNLGYEPGVHYEQPYKVADPYAAGYMSLDEAFELVCRAREIVRHDHTWADDTDLKLTSLLSCVCNAQRLRTSALEDRLAKRTTRQTAPPLKG